MKHYTRSLTLSWRRRLSCSLKPGRLKNSTNFAGKHLLGPFFNKVAFRLEACSLFQKRLHGDLHGDSNIGAFLLNLQNLLEHLFVQNNSGGCFSRLIVTLSWRRPLSYRNQPIDWLRKSKPIRCIFFVKTMANITNRRNVLSNYHLLLLYSRFNSAILRHHPWFQWKNLNGPAPTFPQPFTWFRLCRSSKDKVPR